jgi:xylulose-5-phosphate/fructose-6-phosphate phosphoketolase
LYLSTTTTPFDIVVLNDLDRFHLVIDAIERVPELQEKGESVKQKMHDKLIEHKDYVNRFGDDMLEIKGWKWNH